MIEDVKVMKSEGGLKDFSYFSHPKIVHEQDQEERNKSKKN